MRPAAAATCSNKQTGLGIRALNPVTNALYTAEFIAAAPSPTVYVTNLGFGGFLAFTDASCPVFGLAVNPANDWIYVGSQCQGGPLLEVFDAGTKFCCRVSISTLPGPLVRRSARWFSIAHPQALHLE